LNIDLFTDPRIDEAAFKPLFLPRKAINLQSWQLMHVNVVIPDLLYLIMWIDDAGGEKSSGSNNISNNRPWRDDVGEEKKAGKG